MTFRDLKIGQRLNAGFGLVIALMLLMGALLYLDVSRLAADVKLTTNDRYPKIVRAQSIKDTLNETTRHTRNALLMTDAAEAANELRQLDPAAASIDKQIAELERTIRVPRGVELLGQLKAARDTFEQHRKAFATTAAGDKEAGRQYLFAKLRPAQLAYMAALDQLIAFQTGLMNEAAADTEAGAQHARTIIVVLLSAAVVLAGVVAWLVRRSIVEPLQVAVQAARRVAAGDLSGHIEATSRDETGELLSALHDMNASLLRIVREVRSGTDTIAHASGEIASGNLDLSARTEQQASALEETASSMEELATTVSRNAGSLREANQLAASTAAVATRGGTVVGRVVETMNGISDSSRRIEEIISVIDSIAFQTNILALNAAVEAARAGEQGRGFAVVAGEVRNLAQRSATAAREIKQLIDGSVAQVAAGSQLVAEAGTTMDEMLAAVQQVTGVLGEIAEASHEQDATLAGINTAIVEMDAVTQQNAALVEEAAAAAAALEEQAGRLSSAVSVFTLGDAEPRPVARAHARALRTAPAPAPRRLARQAEEELETT